jgi:hypothetical protein
LSAVGLQIIEPLNGTTFTGTPSVRMRGAVTTPPVPPVTLFFKWYSSLEAPAPPGSPLPGGTTLDFTVPLSIGTHTICFTAKDVSGDDPASLANVRNAGMAGGPVTPANPNGAVIHVLTANMVVPASAGANVSKAAPNLRAAAPSHWWKPVLGPNNQPITPAQFERDSEYQAVNQLRYVWRFAPFGAPAGRASATVTPAVSQLTVPGPFASHVVYNLALPAAVGTGSYDVTLRVEFIPNPAIGHEITRRVNLVA